MSVTKNDRRLIPHEIELVVEMSSSVDAIKLATDIRYDQKSVIDSWHDGYEFVVHPSMMTNIDELEAWITTREGVRSITRRKQT